MKDKAKLIDDGLKPPSPRREEQAPISSPNLIPKRLSLDIRDPTQNTHASFELLSSRSYVSNGGMNKQHTYTVKEEDQEIDETEDEDNHKKNISRRLNNENNLRARHRANIHKLDNDNTENIEFDELIEFEAENLQDPDNEVYK